MQVDNYSGRITYREMAHLILEHMTDEQKDCDVTAADPLYDETVHSDTGSYERKCGDCGGIGLNLVIPDQDGLDNLSLDDNHPVFIALEIGE